MKVPGVRKKSQLGNHNPEFVMKRDYRTAKKRERQWAKDCLEFRPEVLTGKFAHWCYEFDGLPVDETCFEWELCTCYTKAEKSMTGKSGRGER